MDNFAYKLSDKEKEIVLDFLTKFGFLNLIDRFDFNKIGQDHIYIIFNNIRRQFYGYYYKNDFSPSYDNYIEDFDCLKTIIKKYNKYG